MTIRAAAVAVLLSSLAIYVLHEGAAFLAPIFISVLIAYALEPIVELFMRGRVSRSGAALLTYLMLAILAGSLARVTVDQVTAFVDDLPNAVSDVRQMWAHTSSHAPAALTNVTRAAGEIDRAVAAGRPPAPPDVQRVRPVTPAFSLDDYLATAGVSVAVTGVQAVVIGLLSFLMICTGDVYRRKLVAIGGRAFESRRLTVNVIRAIERQIQRYLLVRVVISVIVAVLTGSGLWFLGLSHALVWGVIAGVLNVLPFIGPGVAIVAIAGAAFLQFKAIEPMLIAGAIATAVAALEGNAITPTMTSRAGEINTVAVFVSVLFWGWLWGIAGLILAIPIMVAVKAAADHIEPLQPLGELLGL